MQRSEELLALARGLKIGYLRDNLGPFVLEAASEGWSLEDALCELFSREAESRRLSTLRRHVKDAGFPYRMTLGEFRTQHLSAEVRRDVRVLSTLQFVDEGRNAVLVGNPGVGKTALAVALGMECCQGGGTVRFVSVPNLVVQVKEAMSLNEITRFRKSFDKPDLVVLDDLGYCSFDKECGEVLFNLLSNRNSNGSMVVTTNLRFERWNEVFNDEVLTGAIVDRLAHKAHVVDMTGESFRVIETGEWMRKVAQATE